MAAKVESKVQDFLDRYKVARAKQLEQKASELAIGISRIRPGFEAAKRLRSEHARLVAPDFNLFTILQVSRKESAHSNFLAELLNPMGKHGQRTLFLEKFVRLCERGEGRTSPEAIDVSSWAEKVTVAREATIFNGRCDLLIYAPNHLCVLIENKIDAVEEETQLVRYKDWISKQREPSHNRFLVFLTRQGLSAKSLPDGDYIRLSYVLDLHQWLSNCLQEIQAPHVRSAVAKYVELLAAWRRTKDVETEI